MKKIKLFCFPHAGGSSIVFRKWESFLPPHIELCPVELAGRGRRISEPLYQSINDAVEDVFRIVKQQAQGHTYALFGHSMGAVIAFELARRIRKEKLAPPTHLFFAGKEAPHIRIPVERLFHPLPEEKFKEEVMRLGGTEFDVFSNPQLLDLILPVLKNDFVITETYRYNEQIEPFDIDFTVFTGRDDDLSIDEVSGWLEHTRGICTIHYFPGHHFFIHKQRARVIELVCQRLAPAVQKNPAPAKGFFST